MIEKYVGSFIRHALTTIAGYFGAIGVSAAQAETFGDALTPILVALIFWALGQGSSFLEKVARKF